MCQEKSIFLRIFKRQRSGKVGKSHRADYPFFEPRSLILVRLDGEKQTPSRLHTKVVDLIHEVCLGQVKFGKSPKVPKADYLFYIYPGH